MVNAVPLYNRCDWTQTPVHCRSYGLQSLENLIVFFHPVLTEISGGCSFQCVFFRVSFLPKAIYKHGRQHIFLFFWLMYLVLFYNWEVQERHAFLHNPLSLKSAVYHLFCFVFFCFFEKRLFDILKGESTNECEKVPALVTLEFLRNDDKLPSLI